MRSASGMPRLLRRLALPGPVPPAAAAAAPLIAAHREVFPRADTELLVSAYAAAESRHRGQARKSGEPFITHPLAVATILAGVGMDTDTVAAALLHDTVEDTDLTLDQVAAEFGRDVAMLVDGVTKLDGSRWGKQVAEAETYRKMLIAADNDLRVLVIKIADRLHNLRTVSGHARVEKRRSIARQSMQLLVPLARRLGLYVFVREMEDISLSVLEPRAYERVRDLAATTADERGAGMRQVADDIRKALAAEKIPARVAIRPQHLNSIWETLGEVVGGEDEWLSLRPGEAERIAVIVDGPPVTCYAAMGVLHGRWNPAASRFHDYIAMPRHNLYQALHTGLHVANGITVSVMIRTPEMDQVADYGIASQIRATAGKTGKADLDALQQADRDWLRSILGWQSLSGSDHFLEDAKAELKAAGMVTFTPDGKAIRLPAGSTGIDFAYAIDAEAGNSAAGVTVDGRLQPLAAPLHNGQVVDVIRSEFPDRPAESWLKSARTPQARTHIRKAIAERRADEAERAGREAVRDALAAAGLDLFDVETDGTALQVCRRLAYPDLYALYTAVHAGTIDVRDLAAKLGGEKSAGPPTGNRPAGQEETKDKG